MNLSDFMPLAKTKAANPASNQQAAQKAIALKAQRDAVGLLRPAANHEEGKALTGMSERIQTQLLNARAGILIESGALPEELLFEGDPITLAAQSPKVLLADVRRMADRLSFLLMPFEYLDDRAYQLENYQVTAAIKGFVQDLANWFDIYVLAPIQYYSVNKHVRAKTDSSLYAGKDVAQAFIALAMSIPMFRAILGDVEDLRQRVDRVNARVVSVETELKNLARRIDELQVQAQRQQAEALLAQERTTALQRQLETEISRGAFIALDPVLLAVPKGTGPQADGVAIVGPCWGPDFADVIINALGFKRVDGQRKLLSEMAGRWGGTASRDSRGPYGYAR